MKDDFTTKTTVLKPGGIDPDIKPQNSHENNVLNGQFHQHQNDNYGAIVLISGST
jgi:hypothetical protein